MEDSPFKEFAERHDLDYAEEVAPGGGSLPGGEEVGPIAGGRLPGGLKGIAGHLTQEIGLTLVEATALGPREKEGLRSESSSQGGQARWFRDSCFVMTRVPQSTTFLPYVTCRDSVTRGFADRMVGPGGLIPLVDHVEFESIELNRRYRIGAFKGTSGSRLRQLFSPTLIDWMASTAPDGLFFELFSGVLFLTVSGKVTDTAQIERACELATHLAERIRAEAAESLSAEGTPEFAVSTQEAEYAQKRADTLAAAAFTEPPREMARALERIEPAVKERSKGFLRKVFASINEGEATSLALEALMRGYARERGLDWQRPVDFLARQAGSPLPIAAEQAVRGRLPHVDVEGDLFVRRGTREDNSALAPGATLPWPDRACVMMAVPMRERLEGMETLGGFQVVVTGGERRMGHASKEDAEVSEALEAEFDGRYAVIAEGCRPCMTITPELRSWLLDEERQGEAAAVLAGGVITLLSGSSPGHEWSTASLDELCESLRPLAAALRSGETGGSG